MIYYPVPLHKMRVFVNNGIEIYGSLENSEMASQSILILPIEPVFKEREVDKICKCLLRK
ncbi:DegT/DnrJ/EryC1/StrS family aminotransferase [Dissulfurispira thermophila]|uniref:DegT/DnrJ/EryC1/StrS family aminotransferase n=1 Tax=Dissulfurispira thermophila TaxID=2715679 RepID=UPI00193D6655